MKNHDLFKDIKKKNCKIDRFNISLWFICYPYFVNIPAVSNLIASKIETMATLFQSYTSNFKILK